MDSQVGNILDISQKHLSYFFLYNGIHRYGISEGKEIRAKAQVWSQGGYVDLENSQNLKIFVFKKKKKCIIFCIFFIWIKPI